MYRALLSGLMISTAFFSTSTFAADSISGEAFEERSSGRAVDGVNGKVSLGYAYYDFNDIVTPFLGLPTPNSDQEGFFIEGSLSAPIGDRYGFQIDGIYGSVSEAGADLDLTGVGAHLFWRDPEVGLLGVYGHYKEYGDLIESYNISAEAEIYNGDFTLELLAGVDNLETAFGDDDFFAGEAVLAYYPQENFRIDFGVLHHIDNTQFAVGAEFMKETDTGFASAVFVDASFGEDNTTYVGAGIRLYFGNSAKSLKQRHREDDPKTRLNDNTAAIGTCVNNADSSLFSGRKPFMPRPRKPRKIPEIANVAAVPMGGPMGIPVGGIPIVPVQPVFNDCSLNFPVMQGYGPT